MLTKHTYKILQRAFCFGIASLLTLPLLACGKETPAVTETTTAATATETTTETTAATEAVYGWTADPETMLAATESVPVIEPMLGCWVTPRPHLMTTQADADARYAELRESGINMVYSFGDTGDPAHMDRMLRAAEKNGVRVMIELNRITDAAGIDANLELVRRSESYPAVIGYNMYDEPNAALYPLLGEQLVRIREMVGEEKLIMCNLFPNYANATQLGISSEKDGLTPYQQYVDRFMSEVKSDILSFDFYPFHTDTGKDTDKIKAMLVNFSDVALCAKKYGVPYWGFVQNSSWSGTRVPNENELRFLTHFHMIFGLDSYSYFLYSQPSNVSGGEGIFKGMLTYDGERTEIYDRVKANNEALAGLRGRYLDYELKGFLTAKLSKGYTASIAEELKLDSFGPLCGIESQYNLLIGCFENEAGEQAYYVMNFVYGLDGNVTLDFGDGAEFTLWGSEGIEQMGDQKTVTFDLLPGEGKFLEMKTYQTN
ncbi:MAG: beta-galactosidase [Clostridia bacterium]|nr:beta-galactosidase [Clostridia bacterium]